MHLYKYSMTSKMKKIVPKNNWKKGTKKLTYFYLVVGMVILNLFLYTFLHEYILYNKHIFTGIIKNVLFFKALSPSSVGKLFTMRWQCPPRKAS